MFYIQDWKQMFKRALLESIPTHELFAEYIQRQDEYRAYILRWKMDCKYEEYKSKHYEVQDGNV